MKDIKFKSFIRMSKGLISYSKMKPLGKLKFYLLAPIKYKIFKKLMKEEVK